MAELSSLIGSSKNPKEMSKSIFPETRRSLEESPTGLTRSIEIVRPGEERKSFRNIERKGRRQVKTRKTTGKWRQRRKVRVYKMRNIIVDQIGKGEAPAAVVLPDKAREKEDKRR